MRYPLAIGLVFVVTVPLFAQDDKAALAKKAQAILKANCHHCHGQDGASEGGFNSVLDRARLVAGKKIVPGDAAQSRLYKRMKKEEMPPEDEKVRPTDADLAVIRKWIEAGAPDFETKAATRPEVSPKQVVEWIKNDLENASERDRRFYRYFTITHLYNAGWSDDELQSYRVALSKLVNSLSWGKRVVRPTPIEPTKTIFRIDLRDYRWTDKVWNRITSEYPYGVDVRSPAARYCRDQADCELAYVRADWFVAAASRPPLYHEVLQIPETDKDLEKLLHIDVEENIKQERVCRAAFNGSGVSRNNRLIERHETGYGAYWKSYDFGASSGKQNLFEYPLGPGMENGFAHDGGEIIFTLPNGLQGYMLVDAKGRRIDKGPTTIVSDPKQADRAVVNGLSCMSCHHRGMIEKTDQVRESVVKNPKAFDKKDADYILALYKPKADMDRLLREDADRFARAVMETGGRADAEGHLTGTDPVVNLALMFERELDLPLAAAELGVSSQTLTEAMDRSPTMARTLGVLKVEGGTMQRQAFVVIYRELVVELKVGVFILGGNLDAPAAVAPGLPAAAPGKREGIFLKGPTVFLADLPESDVKAGPWPFRKDGTTGDDKNSKIRVDRNPSPKGLGMHPPSGPNDFASVKYRLNKQAAVFKSTAAIDDATRFCFTPAIFTVHGDGKELFRSKNIAHNHSRSQEVSIDVTGVDELELRVAAIGHNTGLHCVWVEPRVLQRVDTKDTPVGGVKKLFEDGPRSFLTDLQEKVVQGGQWPLGKHGDTGDNKSITFAGRKFPNGLGMHPPQRGAFIVKYTLDKKAAVFRGVAALDDSRFVVSGTGFFEIYGDGNRLWRSAVMNRKNVGPQGFDLNVSGVAELELRTVSEGSNHGIIAVWLEPRLLEKKDTPDK